MIIKIFSPQFRLLIPVVENLDTSCCQTLGEGLGMDSIVSGERECHVVLEDATLFPRWMNLKPLAASL